MIKTLLAEVDYRLRFNGFSTCDSLVLKEYSITLSDKDESVMGPMAVLMFVTQSFMTYIDIEIPKDAILVIPRDWNGVGSFAKIEMKYNPRNQSTKYSLKIPICAEQS